MADQQCLSFSRVLMDCPPPDDGEFVPTPLAPYVGTKAWEKGIQRIRACSMAVPSWMDPQVLEEKQDQPHTPLATPTLDSAPLARGAQYGSPIEYGVQQKAPPQAAVQRSPAEAPPEKEEVFKPERDPDANPTPGKVEALKLLLGDDIAARHGKAHPKESPYLRREDITYRQLVAEKA